MRKGLLAITIVLLCMVGWTAYEFLISSSEEGFTANIKNVFKTEGEGEISPEKEVGLEVGDLAPDFHLTTLSGEEVALADYRGSKVMVNFWATWCPPCRAEMPEMEKFYQETEVEILAVNLTETEQSPNQVQQFIDEYELTFPILLDEEIKVATNYEIKPVPTSFMIDSEGIIQFKTFGPLTYDKMIQVSQDMN